MGQLSTKSTVLQDFQVIDIYIILDDFKLHGSDWLSFRV